MSSIAASPGTAFALEDSSHLAAKQQRSRSEICRTALNTLCGVEIYQGRYLPHCKNLAGASASAEALLDRGCLVTAGKRTFNSGYTASGRPLNSIDMRCSRISMLCSA